MFWVAFDISRGSSCGVAKACLKWRHSLATKGGVNRDLYLHDNLRTFPNLSMTVPNFFRLWFHFVYIFVQNMYFDNYNCWIGRASMCLTMASYLILDYVQQNNRKLRSCCKMIAFLFPHWLSPLKRINVVFHKKYCLNWNIFVLRGDRWPVIQILCKLLLQIYS